MIFTTEPADFKSKFDVVSCFCQYKNTFLLLQRLDSKPQGGKWGIPAGKVDTREDLEQAVKREVQEETGIKLKSITHLGKLYTRFPDLDFIFHMFVSDVSSSNVVISPKEHTSYRWVDKKEAFNMDLIMDLGDSMKLLYK